MSTSTGAMRSASTSPAFRELFEAELAFVCRALRRLGVREADLADVAQELFLTVHARYGEYDASRPVRTWLYAFCIRFASNYRKLARHRGEGLEDHVARAVDKSEAAAARDLVMRALDRLDEDRRVVLVLHDMEGVAAPEIADIVKAPLNTVYSRIRLARSDFRAAVDSLGKEARS